MHATVTAALSDEFSDEFIDTVDSVLFLAWKHACGQHVCGQHVCDHHAPLDWAMVMVRAKSALRVLTACTSEQADEALEQALEREEG